MKLSSEIAFHAGMCHWVKNSDGFWVCGICGRPK